MRKVLCLFAIIFCWGCTSGSKTEIYQDERDKVLHVKDKVKEIVIDDVMIGGISRLQLMDDYLMIADHKSYDKLIHLFNLNGFSYVTSIGDKGEGPGEITILGYIGIDEAHRKFYVNDHGKYNILSYDLDSVLRDEAYMPTVKMNMGKGQYPDEYLYVNDALCIGRIIEPLGYNDFIPRVAKWNMITGEIKPMKYKHPQIEKKRICFAVSMENGVYVEGYNYHDLITICSLDGELKYNIYGPKWDERKSNAISYFQKPVICKNRLLVSYSGERTFTKNQLGGIKSNCPTKLMMFDLDGNYIQTLETGYGISDYCYDVKNNRIIMSLDDENLQFAYLSLDGLIL